MATQDLLDTITRHQILIQRLSGGEARKAQKGIKRLITRVQDELGKDLTIIQRSRYQQILFDLQQYARNVYDDVGASVQEYADDFIDYEAEFSADAFTKATGTSFDLPSPNQLKSAYTTNVMSLKPNTAARSFGELMRNWASQSRVQFDQILRDGFALGQTSQQMVSQVREHVSLKSNQVETLIRTGTNHLATVARNETMQENEDILDGYEWVATLDSRTTFICMSRDGIIYPISNNPEKSPKPPAHYGCRSTIVPQVKKEFDLLADEEESRPSVGSSGVKVIKGNVNYEQWLRRQSKEFQIEVLGRERQKLFADQKLPLSRFVDNDGRVLSLQELRDADVQFNGMSVQEVAQQTIAEPERPQLQLANVKGDTLKLSQAERILNDTLDPVAIRAAAKLPKPTEIVSRKNGGLYESGAKRVTTDIREDGNDVHAVTAHEYGHHVDYEIGKKLGNQSKSWSETDGRFQEAFKLDRKNLGLVPTKTRKKEAYNTMAGTFRIRQVDGRGAWDFDELPTKGNLCDILDAMTGGVCRGDLGGFGHAKSYWTRSGAKEKETFANMYSIYGTDDWKEVERLFPNTAKRFVQILKEIAE